MNPLVRPLYAAAGRLAEAAAAALPPASGKLGRSIAARRGVLGRFERWAAGSRDPARALVWMHAPSVGEGLQARPILESLRRTRPDAQLIYTYYSPSAAELAGRLDVDYRDVLPFDTARAASSLLSAVRPTALLFSKLDVWPLLVEAASERRIALGLTSATLPASSTRVHGAAALVLRDAYAALDAVGAISDEDASRLVDIGCRPAAVTVTGDTRFDQVAARVAAVDLGSPLLAPLRSTRPTLVAGSTWPADERELLPALTELRREWPRLRAIIAPHEPTAEHLAPIERWAATAGVRLARLGSPEAPSADVVLVDRVGVLGELYALADIAFVGGAFHGAGIHSVLEPAACGAPVLFGPRHANSREASLLLAAGGGRDAGGSAGLRDAIAGWLRDEEARRRAGAAARGVVDRGRGATARSVALVEGLLARAR